MMGAFKYLPAKKTKFAGQVYRSKTEALWAVVLSKSRLRVQYETKWPGVYYLPDFLVGSRVYVEVKPGMGEGEQIPQEWLRKACELVRASGRPLLMVFGEPSHDTQVLLVTCDLRGGAGRLLLSMDEIRGVRGVREYLRQNAS